MTVKGVFSSNTDFFNLEGNKGCQEVFSFNPDDLVLATKIKELTHPFDRANKTKFFIRKIVFKYSPILVTIFSEIKQDLFIEKFDLKEEINDINIKNIANEVAKQIKEQEEKQR